MISEEKCYCGVCDNCGEIFDNGEYSLFPLESDVREQMSEREWYTGIVDPDHNGKHYCPECFKYDEEIDDKIIVDIARYKQQP